MTTTLFLAVMLCTAADAQAAPTALEFKDTATYENRSMQQYRAIEFRTSPVRPLGDDRTFKPGTLYGVVPVGQKPETALTIVWLPKGPDGPELWLDANGDGKLTDDECHKMTGRDLEIPATIVVQAEPTAQVQRTLLFRRSTTGDNLRFTVRGYMQGRLNLGEKAYPVLLIDGNADGLFNTVGQDRVWIDLNEDNRFDGLTEQFPLGKPITQGQDIYVVRSDATATAVVANLRSVGQGKIRLTLNDKAPTSAKITAELVSDLGEWVIVDKLNEAVPLPFGDYRLQSLKVEANDSAGEPWTYRFYSDKGQVYSVPTGQETTVPLLQAFTMNIEFRSEQGNVKPGQTVTVQPKLTADQSFYLSGCTIGKETHSRQAEGSAEVVLLAPDGKVVAQGTTGFS